MTDEQAATMIELLTEIRNSIIYLTMPEPEMPCQHPDDVRRDLTSMGEIEWICRTCGYHYYSEQKATV